MAQVRMLRALRSAGHNGEHFPPVGEVAEVDDAKASALVHYKYAERVKVEDEKPEGDKPATADARETADVKPAETRAAKSG